MDFLLVLLMHFPLVLARAKRQYFTSSKMHYGKCTGMDGAMGMVQGLVEQTFF